MALWVCACGAGFDEGSRISSLRVLGVEKAPSYPAPGEVVTLRMLWYDGNQQAQGREIQRLWFPLPCTNPAGDSYYACLAKFAEAVAGFNLGGAEGDTSQAVGAGMGLAGASEGALAPLAQMAGSLGDQWTFTIPANILESRLSLPAGQVPYGLTYAFFAVCAGDIYVRLDQKVGFPLVCKDSGGNYLGPDDFVVGYSGLYTYPADSGITNRNPVIEGFALQGQATEPGTFCIGADCTLPQVHPSNEQELPLRHMPACAGDGGDSCPEHAIYPLLDPGQNQEIDALSSLEGQRVSEQMWVRYYVERGGLKSQVRLVADARRGWNDDYGTAFRAPSSPGPMFIWAVVQDNRGGTAWIRQTVFID
jgi:hypothetical protein